MSSLIIACDFDDTLAKLEKDYIPKTLLPNAKEVINWAHKKGCYVIIWTVRSNDMLQLMIDFLKENDIKYDAINENYPELGFETSRKIYYDLIIDDKGLCDINWLEIKRIIKKKMIAKLANEIENLLNEL
jgi:hydroxymethylpyrimidine pyrophosphatase-like HAD family hydrolase